jgi:xylulose-5-phosphate/fructose-6-phosphate phosphoketolase
MSANPHTNGGALLCDLELPDWRDYAVEVPAPATVVHEATRVLNASSACSGHNHDEIPAQ